MIPHIRPYPVAETLKEQHINHLHKEPQIGCNKALKAAFAEFIHPAGRVPSGLSLGR